MDRETIINKYNKNEFMYFLEHDINGSILDLLNEEGLEILDDSRLREERITYILAYSKYKNELLKNTLFLDVFLNTHISTYYAVLNNLEPDTYDAIIKRCVELKKDSAFLTKLFDYFNLDYKLKKLDNWDLSTEMLYDLIKRTQHYEVIQKIISKHDIDLTEYNIDLSNFFYVAKMSTLNAQAKRNVNNIIIEDIRVPQSMMTEKVYEKIWQNNNIFKVRKIINDAAYCTDITQLNNYIKNKEEQIIEKYNPNVLVSPFQELYESFRLYKLEEMKEEQNFEYNRDKLYKYKRNFMKYANSINDKTLEKIDEIYNNSGIDRVFEYIKTLNENALSNYIIDYHFEENYHNIMLDVRELLQFYYNGEIVIPKERIELYDKISNIDWLLPEEKLELHKNLKNYNMIDLFYDDMLMARRIVSEAIKEYSLSSQSIKQYKDEELSKEYGVDVYNMNGEPFFGIVKSRSRLKDKLPTGHSFSLIGNGCLAVYSSENTYLYDSNDMNPDQLVHVFPFDSFTYYHPLEQELKGTNRVNTLSMPNEVLEASRTYNELLILEKGTIETDLDKSIPELKRIAVYCVDKITEEDVINAKRENVGIILVNSRMYKKMNNLKTNNFNHWEHNYFDGEYELDKFESKRY
ncbi:MAG: hypothetical protein E7170_02260 [Firmicutes bacterium]|nr:hypothetical protein [Bacillota bacterium]